jgi:uncharacterized membrane protein YkvA (DUF1232 family)
MTSAESQGFSMEHVGRILVELGRMIGRVATDSRVPARLKVLMGLAVVYVVAPVDLLPDFIPGAGRLDDLMVLLLALDMVLNHVPESVIREHWRGDPAELEDLKRWVGQGVQLVPRAVRSKIMRFA